MKIVSRVVILVAIFGVMVVAGRLIYDRVTGASVTQAAAASTRIQYTPVTRGNLAATVSTTGGLIPVTQVKLSFRTSGVLKELNVRVGNTVKAGDVLAKLDTADLETTLAKAQIDLENAQIKYQQALIGPKQEDIIIAQNNLEKAAINLAKAQGDYDRIAWRGDVAMTSQAMALQQATLDYQTAQANYAKATAGSSAQDLQLLLNSVKAAQLTVDQARRNLLGASIVAPFDGIVGSVGANVGEQVGANATLISLVSLNGFRLDANLDETDISKVQVGQTVTIRLDSLPDVRLTGQVVAIAPNATVQSGVVTYQIQIAVTENDPRLRGGLTATASIIVDQRTNALLLPNRAIKVSRNVRTVQVLGPEGKLMEKQVRTGLANDTYTEILEGVSEGEQVAIVTTGTTTSGQGGPGGFAGMPAGGMRMLVP